MLFLKLTEKSLKYSLTLIWGVSCGFQVCSTAPGEARTLLNSPVRNATQLCCTPYIELAPVAGLPSRF